MNSKDSKHWTYTEVQILERHYQDDIESLTMALPGRTQKAILQKISRLGLERCDNHQSDVRIVLCRPGAILPAKGHDNDFAYDCIAVSCEEIAPHVYRYGLGIRLQKVIMSPSCRVGFRIAPRSSVWKTGMVLTNSEGIVDEGYTGEISAVFYHIRPEMPRYQVGERVCQLYMQHSRDIKFIPATEAELNQTERGAGREGSTGK